MTTTIDNNKLRELVLKYWEGLDKYWDLEGTTNVPYETLNVEGHKLEDIKGEIWNYHTITYEEFFGILKDTTDVNSLGCAWDALEEWIGWEDMEVSKKVETFKNILNNNKLNYTFDDNTKTFNVLQEDLDNSNMDFDDLEYEWTKLDLNEDDYTLAV